MSKQPNNRRLIVLTTLLCLGFVGLGYRLLDLQVIQHQELWALAKQNVDHTYFLQPRRGDIRGVRGTLLATSIFVKTICGDPYFVGPYSRQVAGVLAPLLEVDAGDLANKLKIRVYQTKDGRWVTNRYVVLRRDVLPDRWLEISNAMAHLKVGISEKNLSHSERMKLWALRHRAIFPDAVDDQLRVYPNHRLAAHVLGFVGEHVVSTTQGPFRQTEGRAGIEYVMNSFLTGIRGWRQTELDRRQRELFPFRGPTVAAQAGWDVVLTIDAQIQYIVESELARGMKAHSPHSISAIVVRPQTGEILAMANRPTFDPNDPGSYSAAERRNRAVSDMSEPGSTFKIVTVGGALNDGLVRLDTLFNCENGRFAYGGRVLRDHARFGELSVKQIISRSSNIGAAKIGLLMGKDRLYHYILDYGFGTPTGIPLTGEASGIVRPPGKWSKVAITRIPMGQGIACTPLQMVMAMSAVANHGLLMRPMLVDRLEDQNGHVQVQYYPQSVRQVIRPASAYQLVQALKQVVSPEGTAPEAQLKNYVVAGKTGTAQKPGPGGYLPDAYFCSFIGFFPADHPAVCISVVLDNPDPRHGHYGGSVAGPIFHRIAQRVADYLGIPPDRPSDTMEAKSAEAGGQAVLLTKRPNQTPF